MSTAKDFKIIPPDSELESLKRDLMFRPANSASAKTLSREQIESYNANGFIRPVEIYAADEMLAIRQYFDRLLEQAIAAGGNSYSISTAHMKYGGVYDILTNSRIIDCVADLLGDDVVAWGSHFFCKMPGDGRAVAWHQDASYWPLTPSHAVTVWLAIDDADLDNGCMKFISGSHHSGHLTYRKSSPEEHNVLDQTVPNAESYGAVVVDDLKAGQASIHNDLLLHGSDVNMSTRRRCGLTLRYAAGHVRAGMNWNEKGVVVCGSDPSGHWANPSRPTVE
ncbi:MAG TPA: phytanoyl-CoA dioxygenase family protein [Planctomycetaceae bacterium]|nr:phytanoyl-CoA dioxygenase family protein [Planctomycetaceae bacterium]